jgi:hypothetical protein
MGIKQPGDKVETGLLLAASKASTGVICKAMPSLNKESVGNLCIFI